MKVYDVNDRVVFEGKSDAECVRWWQREGCDGDVLGDTGELMSDVEAELGLEP
jgi:hypothetical protein